MDSTSPPSTSWTPAREASPHDRIAFTAPLASLGGDRVGQVFVEGHDVLGRGRRVLERQRVAARAAAAAGTPGTDARSRARSDRPRRDRPRWRPGTCRDPRTVRLPRAATASPQAFVERSRTSNGESDRGSGAARWRRLRAPPAPRPPRGAADTTPARAPVRRAIGAAVPRRRLQQAAHDLAARGLRQLVDDLDDARVLVGRHPLAGERLDLVARSTCDPGFRLMTALIVSPRYGSGTPTTAASRTAGCRYSTSSTSRGHTLKPDATIMSFARSTR